MTICRNVEGGLIREKVHYDVDDVEPYTSNGCYGS
jgi:hypothetical protein